MHLLTLTVGNQLKSFHFCKDDQNIFANASVNYEVVGEIETNLIF